MSKLQLKSQTKSDEYFDKLKENYVLRIQECDNFSKRLSNACADVNTEFLFGILNLVQEYIDLQKRYARDYPQWFNHNLAVKQSKLITESWIQSVQYLDSFYVEFLKYTKSALRYTNKILIQGIQDVKRFYEINERMYSVQDKEATENEANPKQIVSKKESSQS